uniref:Cyclic GMP-AMP synthase n=2 Tax=Anas platyrhynchos TaxID=8839 RepID=A0A493SZI9_ANAPP
THRDTEPSAPGWGRRRTPRAAPTPPHPSPAAGTDGADPVREQQGAGPAASTRRRPAARTTGTGAGWRQRQAAPGPAAQHGSPPAPSTRHPARPRNGKRRPKEPPRPAAPGRPSAAARPPAAPGGRCRGSARPRCQPLRPAGLSFPRRRREEEPAARLMEGPGERRQRAVRSKGSAGPAVAVPPLRLRAVLSQLSLGRRDVSEASGLVNQVVSHLIQAIRGRDGGFGTVSRLGAGSYYERVKISEPNEFDIMLVMPIARIQLDECDDTGAYYYLTFKRNPKEKYLNRFLDEDGKLSADKMLTALRKIIKEEVKNIKDVEVTVKRRKARSPAITLLIKNSSAEISVDIILALEVQQSWPPSTQDGLNIERWLGRKVRRELRNKPIYLVAKQNKKEKVPRGNTWRISFSHIEKAMMNNHGSIKTCCETDGAKCCRKDCLKLLKYLLEKLKMKYTKELEKFCSYHVKTAFFHSCVIWPNDTDWQYENLEHCFQNYLGYFLRCLQDSQLPHFFIPQYNLLSPDDKASNHFLSRQINDQLNNRFPIFQQGY